MHDRRQIHIKLFKILVSKNSQKKICSKICVYFSFLVDLLCWSKAISIETLQRDNKGTCYSCPLRSTMFFIRWYKCFSADGHQCFFQPIIQMIFFQSMDTKVFFSADNRNVFQSMDTNVFNVKHVFPCKSSLLCINVLKSTTVIIISPSIHLSIAKLCPSIFQRQIALYSPCCQSVVVTSSVHHQRIINASLEHHWSIINASSVAQYA